RDRRRLTRRTRLAAPPPRPAPSAPRAVSAGTTRARCALSRVATRRRVRRLAVEDPGPVLLRQYARAGARVRGASRPRPAGTALAPACRDPAGARPGG